MKLSDAHEDNPDFQPLARLARESNLDWGRRAALAMETASTKNWTHLLLLGGADLMSFRLRAAQAHLRPDMFPSYWSEAAIVVLNGGALDDASAIHVPLLQPEGGEFATWTNGVVEKPLRQFARARQWPNIALIALPVGQDAVLKAVDEFSRSRTSFDVLEHVLRWLAFAWGSGGAGNPLHDNVGLPSACLLEAVFASQQFDLTPGLESRRSCPEAIWAAAKRWHAYYRNRDLVIEANGERSGQRPVPRGRYVIGHSYPIEPNPKPSLVERRRR